MKSHFSRILIYYFYKPMGFFLKLECNPIEMINKEG